MSGTVPSHVRVHVREVHQRGLEGSDRFFVSLHCPDLDCEFTLNLSKEETSEFILNINIEQYINVKNEKLVP